MSIDYLLAKLVKRIHIPAIKESNVDKTARVCSGSHLVNVELGKYSYIGNFCTVLNTEIGRFCSIADNCIIGGANHPITWVSTSPVFHQGVNVMRKNFSNHHYKAGAATTIGHDVWIGNNCLIKGGVTIGTGAVVGMGSVVTKDIPPYEIWAGNPAKLIRRRFDEDTIELILRSEWWNLDESTLTQRAAAFDKVESFIRDLNDEQGLGQ